MVIKKCRVCGKDYAACKNAVRNPNNKTFRWQEVACSPECGSEYFRQVEMSRNTQASVEVKAEEKHIVNSYIEEDIDEDVESLFDDAEPDEFGDE